MPAPAAPTNFAVDESAILHFVNGAVSNKSAVRLTWTNNAPTAQHRIEKSSNGASWSLATIADLGDASAVVAKLANNAVTYLRIRAENEEGASAWQQLGFQSSPLATAANPPLAPANLAVSDITGYGAKLTWEDQSGNEAYFVIEVRRGAAEVRERRVEGMTELHQLDLGQLYSYETVPNQLFTVRVKAIGGSANGSNLPPFSSAWSNEVTFRTGPPTVRITSPMSVTAEHGQMFNYAITTNTPCNAWTADIGLAPGEQLPAGLARNNNVISGVLTAPALSQPYRILLTATDGQTIGSMYLTLRVVANSITIISQPQATGKLGVPFSFLLRAVRSVSGPAMTWTMQNAPAWLALNAATGQLSGTPDVDGVFTLQVTVTDGTRSRTGTLTITIPPISITSDEEIVVYVGEPFTHTLTATSPAAGFELIDPPAWLHIDGTTLYGTAPEVGTFEVDVVASIDDEATTQTLRIIVKTLIAAPDEIHGWQGDPLVDVLAYNGECEVAHWYLSGAPPGIEIGSLACPGPYGESSNVVAFTGIPTAPGFYDATVIAHICCDGIPKLVRRSVRFVIDGGLFLSWLHENRKLYDLQLQIRGNVDRRKVESYYQREAIPASEAQVTTEDTSTAGVKKVSTAMVKQPEVTASLLTAKRGDSLRLALIIRDGRKVLGPADGLTQVGIAFRLPDSPDEEYVFDKPAVPTEVGGHVYYAVEIEVTDDILEVLMAGKNLSGANSPPVELLGEIFCVFNGLKISSATFSATFAEDIRR